MNIIGVAGLPRSGKDSLADLYIESGYFGVSLGDIVREESRKRHKNQPDPISVKNMTETSNYLRNKYGSDFALKRALKKYKDANKLNKYLGLVVYSVRAPIEADFVLKNKGRLIWVEASDKVRFERSISARRDGEPILSMAEMLLQEKLQEAPQKYLSTEIQMNTKYVKKVATDIFVNNGNDFKAFKTAANKKFKLKKV